MVGAWDDGCDADAVHAGKGPQADGGRRNKAARIAGGNERIGLLLAQQLHRPQDGTILFSPEPLDGFVLHGEELGGMHDSDAGVAKLRAVQDGVDFVTPADEVQFSDFVTGLKRLFGTFDDDRRAMVATHDIHHDTHKQKSAEEDMSVRALKLLIRWLRQLRLADPCNSHRQDTHGEERTERRTAGRCSAAAATGRYCRPAACADGFEMVYA